MMSPPASSQPAAEAPVKSDEGGAPLRACSANLSALSGIACELQAQLGDALGKPDSGALVISGPLDSDTPLERSSELVQRITRVVAGKVGGKAHETQTTRGAAQLAARSRAFLYLEVRIAHGRLEVTADVYRPVKGFWARVRNPTPEPLKHAFASRALDAEVRSFFPTVPLVAGKVLKVKAPEAQVLALGCGDIDGDSALELVLVGRGAVHVGRIRGGKFVASARRNWSGLSPVAPVPLREPIASVSIGPGHVDVGLTDRAKGFRFDVTLDPIGTLAAPIPWPGNGCIETYQTLLGRKERPCRDKDAPSTAPGYEHRGDAVAGTSLIDTSGKRHQYRALRAAKEQRVDLRSDRGGRASLANLGAQLAMGDLDGDGAPELVASTPTMQPADDALIVYSWKEPAAPAERLRIAAPGGVSAITTCPAEDAARSYLVAAVADELWLIR
ncbi:MAG: hypothetical protein KC492_02300 [Myxococcales bacterium]|nr:hypothetical protein [Myxococcales bacterium]